MGVLAGIGALVIPGVGPFIAAGPIMAGLAGIGVGGLAQKAESIAGSGHVVNELKVASK